MKIYRSLSNIQKELRKGSLSCVQLTKSYLQRIKDLQHLNAFLEVFDEASLSGLGSLMRSLNRAHR